MGPFLSPKNLIAPLQCSKNFPLYMAENFHGPTNCTEKINNPKIHSTPGTQLLNEVKSFCVAASSNAQGAFIITFEHHVTLGVYSGMGVYSDLGVY